MKHFSFKYQHPMAAYKYTPCGARYEDTTTIYSENVTCPKCKKWLKEAIMRRFKGKEEIDWAEKLKDFIETGKDNLL